MKTNNPVTKKIKPTTSAPVKPVYVSRDLSWLKFNERVLDQAKTPGRTIFEKLKFFIIITANLDEFFMIRVGSLYNYIDYKRQRIDYSGLREVPFRKKLLFESRTFFKQQSDCYLKNLVPAFEKNGFSIVKDITKLIPAIQKKLKKYFKKTIFPMLTPMVFDGHHTFPILMNKLLVFGVVTRHPKEEKGNKKLSFIQIPQNLSRFYEAMHNHVLYFIPIEEIIRTYLYKLFRNVEIVSITLFRVTRNGDFSLEESDDIEANFLQELTQKLKKRKTGRVVRVEIAAGYDTWMIERLQKKWRIDKENLFEVAKNNLIDFTGLAQIIQHDHFKDKLPTLPDQIPPLVYTRDTTDNIFDILDQKDMLLHHPYNSMAHVIDLIEKAAEDPYVLAIKLTIYRLAKDSAITAALRKAIKNGKHVSVLFELKARFDEENNMREAKKLQKAGCLVIYGRGNVKTHAKLLLIVRKKGAKVNCYVHMASGNYNEETSKVYADIGLLTTNEVYARDATEFFNVITGHSQPKIYETLITAPLNMRKQLIGLIEHEAKNAQAGLSCGIVIKINSLQDEATIDALYKAAQAGVKIELIVRGICCLVPGKKTLSENITVRSIVGELLEHARIFYFHNYNNPKIYVGSADIMVRSFDRRIESLFIIKDKILKKQITSILSYNLRDNVNTYLMRTDGSYIKKPTNAIHPFNIHHEFFNLSLADLGDAQLF